MKPTKKCPVCEKVKKETSFCNGDICKRCNASVGRIAAEYMEDDAVLLAARDDIMDAVLARGEGKSKAKLGEIGASEIVYKLGVYLAKNRRG